MVVDNNGTPGNTGDDFVTYTPPAGFFGTDTFEYAITDADGRTSTATVTIVILRDGDGDNIPDLLDLDSDNDGIPDFEEVCGVGATDFSCLPGGSSPFADDDEDGILNYLDADFCTLNAAGVCTDLDADGDGVIDPLDLDSDNDGIADVIEAGGADTDGDGIVDGFSDVNNNGYDDDTEASPLPVTNSDTDAFPDYIDIDSENDGIIDNIESQTTAGYRPPSGDDTDGDGWDDEYDANNGGTTIVITNTDMAADNPDYLDDDSDDDTILDNIEGHDGDSNGTSDVAPIDSGDADNDGLYNSYDPDFLGAACTSSELGQPGNGGCAPLQDTDGTEDRDWRDNDDDGDGILTADEPTDADGSGIPDYLESMGDNDGDGIPDNIDLDDDNDGIPDTEESGGLDATGDADNDGTPNYADPDFCTANGGTINSNGVCDLFDNDGDGIINQFDLDSDNDGIPDIIEAGGGALDTDGDGIIDDLTDANNNGLADVAEGGGALPVPNTDGDGVPDFLDLDSDNDGIADVIEAGGADTDGDGIVDGFSDVNNNGYDDDTEASPLPVTNSDTDAFPDYIDIDSENDGIIDNIESQTTAGYRPPSGDDTDGDGWDDEYDANNGGTTIVITNTDMAADNPDYLDDDSDDDTIPDNIEGHDGDSNGTSDVAPIDSGDADNDGLYNSYDPDFLGAACTNSELGQPGNGGCAPLQDTDGTEDRDWRDNDDDGDGILTADEPTDVDGSGIPDYLEAIGDNDGDGVNDLLDLDDDNDGIPDTEEACGPGAIDFSCLPGGGNPVADSDNDGTPNYQDPDFCTLNANGVCEILDSDGDGIIDQFDLDSDNDGIPDITEAGGGALDADGDGVIDDLTDDDTDGLADMVDPDQGGTPLPVTDSDGDGVPNHLDLDSDNDGITDVIEAGGPDADGDGRIDGFIDADVDGLADSVDPTEAGTPLNIPNSDGDPYPDYLDIDAEDDGIVDNIESQSTDGYRPPSGSDADNDGYDDAYDPTEGGTPITLEDTDGDTTPDFRDDDTDGDGVLDNIEGHDADSDGVPDLTASGSDSDADGLDDAYDPDFISCNSTELGQPGNGGCAALQNTDGTDDRDWRDTDDDNDGDPTLDEGPGDCDSDGIPNYLDDRDICDEDLVIYNGFSPNGDNKNDVWILDGIEKFPGNTVKVYNRWGNLVWQTEGYDNQGRAWRGESTEGIILGEKMVPDGSYFYVIDLGNGSDPLSGYVVIHR